MLAIPSLTNFIDLQTRIFIFSILISFSIAYSVDLFKEKLSIKNRRWSRPSGNTASNSAERNREALKVMQAHSISIVILLVIGKFTFLG